MTKIIFLGIVLLSLISCCYAYDLEITPRQNNFIVNTSVSNLFEIKNLDYYENRTSQDIVFEYNVTFNDRVIISETKIFENFKSKKYANTGKIFVEEEGRYTICGKIYSNATESNYSNNKICKKFTTLDTNIKCDFSPQIYLENNQNIINKSQIRFKIYANNLYNQTSNLPYIVEYWIEDSNSNIVKKKYNTTNTLFKTYTTKSIGTKTLVIKSKVYSKSCIDQNKENNNDLEIVLVRNVSTQQKIVDIKDLKVVGNVLFANIKTFKNNSNSDISIWLESEGKLISNKFEFKVLSELEPFEFSIPIFFQSDKQTAKLVINAFGTKYEQIVSISNLSEEISLNSRNVFKTENVINSQKVGLSIKKRVIPAALSLLLSIANIIRV